MHESLVMLFRECPDLGPRLLGDVIGQDMPGSARARITSAEFSDLRPAEYRADVVVRIESAAESDPGELLEAVIVEVQLQVDDDKRWTWPLYVASARARLRCPVSLLVVALERSVADWCREAIPLGRGGSAVLPLVLGPDEVPRITDWEQARSAPELAVLSAVAHGDDADGSAIGLAALAACDDLDDHVGATYADLVYASLHTAARAALESLMSLVSYTYQSDFARKYERQGIEKGARSTLQKLLVSKFGDLPEDIAATLDAGSLEQLEVWIERFVHARTLDEIFDS